MVNDGGSGLVNLKTNLRGNVLDSCSAVTAGCDQDVAARVDEVDKILSLDASAKF